MDDLNWRLERIYSSIGATVHTDVPKYERINRFQGPKSFGMFIDYRGNSNDADLENMIQSVVQNVGSLRDHIKHWADKRGRDVSKVNAAIRASRPLQIITDLWNIDKHKELDRAPWSGMMPRLKHITSAMQITAKAGQGWVFHTWNPTTGKHSTNVPESRRVVVDAEVVDEQGKLIGGFQELVKRAVYDWEQLIQRLA